MTFLKTFWIKKEERSEQLMFDFEHNKVVIADKLFDEEELMEDDKDLYGFHHSFIRDRFDRITDVTEVTYINDSRYEVVNNYDE